MRIGIYVGVLWFGCEASDTDIPRGGVWRSGAAAVILPQFHMAKLPRGPTALTSRRFRCQTPWASPPMTVTVSVLFSACGQL